MNDYAVYPISDVAISFGEDFVHDLSGFYADNGFYKFGSRAAVEGGKSITYDQLFLFLK